MEVTGYIDPTLLLSKLGWMGLLEVWAPPVALGAREETASLGVMEGTQSDAVRAACPPRATGCPRPHWKGRGAPSVQTAPP